MAWADAAPDAETLTERFHWSALVSEECVVPIADASHSESSSF
jgi:hypothetical protein